MQMLEALRTGTRHLHERLDRSISRHPIASEEGYVRFLQMQSAVLPSAEHWLREQTGFANLPDHDDRLRAGALKNDLEKLGLGPLNAPDMSFLNDDCSVIGISYVLEGSRLGAAYLCSLLDKSQKDFPSAFLRHGQGRGFWRTFLAWLPKQDNSNDATAKAVHSARQMFEAYLFALANFDDRNHLVEQC